MNKQDATVLISNLTARRAAGTRVIERMETMVDWEVLDWEQVQLVEGEATHQEGWCAMRATRAGLQVRTYQGSLSCRS